MRLVEGGALTGDLVKGDLLKGDPALLAAAAAKARPIALAEQATLAVDDRWRDLLVDGGLRRGSVLGVTGSGATAAAFGLLSEASSQGSWLAAVGSADLGLLAAAEQGIALERLLVIPSPGAEWPAVVAACADAVDLVLVVPPRHARAGDQRRIVSRVRERGAVLVLLRPGEGWEIDLRITVSHERWHGLADGHGAITTRTGSVEVVGRRAAARPRSAELRLVS
jgi:hypothetical protein